MTYIITIALIAITVLATTAYFSFTEFRPPPRLDVEILPATGTQPGQTLTLVSWNIGYASLDAQNDFFADGGTNSRARSKKAVEHNLDNIADKLLEIDADVILLQEVDRKADRSHAVMQLAYFQRRFSRFNRSYAENYRVPYVPIPLRRPLGAVASGLLILSRPNPVSALRLALDSEFFWPKRIFYPRRCLLVNSYKLSDGRLLLIVNLHLSAFDPGGILRRRQLRYIKELMAQETAAGNLMILGGDFNNVLPDTPTPEATDGTDDISWLISLPRDWTPPGWTWATDKSIPTVRTLGSPLAANKTHFAHIDGFLLSPGIELKAVSALDLGFTNSDHNPVVIEVTIEGFTTTGE
jgi:endonuclease/exonuclease/phosphatase family metal-dependent hydrolase